MRRYGREEVTGGKMSALGSKIKWMMDNTGVDEALLEAFRVGLATGIAVMLATGAPILDMSNDDFRTVASGAIAATLQVIVRALNPEDTKFGVGKVKVAREEQASTAHITGSAIDTDGDGIADELAGSLAGEAFVDEDETKAA
jgi:hypothetical protein